MRNSCYNSIINNKSTSEVSAVKYYLMHRKTPVAEIKLDEKISVFSEPCKPINPKHFPIGVPVDENGSPDMGKLRRWWERRSIPDSRPGLRDLILNDQLPRREELLKGCHGLSLSDQYWITLVDSPLSWDDVNFFDNPFSEDIGDLLFGGKVSSKKPNLISPDSTSDGWLKKRWKIIDGKRCLVKGGSGMCRQEPYNEAIASLVCRKLGIPHVAYSVIWDGDYPYSVCEDFIDSKSDLVSAYFICETKPFNEGDDLYKHFNDCCRDLGIPDVKAGLYQMIVLDFIIANTDRHYGNFGIIRDAETLEWRGLAPMFDNGTSMWNDLPDKLIKPDGEIKGMTFYRDLNAQLDLVTRFNWLNLDALTGIEDECAEVLKTNPYIENERRKLLCSALRRRVELLGEYINNKHSI